LPNRKMTDLLGVIRNVIKCFPNGKFTAHAVHPVSPPARNFDGQLIGNV